MLHRLFPLSLLGISLFVLALGLPSAVIAEEEGNGEPANPPAEADAEPTEEDAPSEEPAPKEGEGEEPAEESTTGQKPGEPPMPAPAGMAYVEGGRVLIGSDYEYLDGILAGRPELVRKLFLYETPPHHRFLRPYFIGKFEVTNAQYHRHLQDYLVTYDTASGSLANLDEIAAHLVGLSQDEQKSKHQVVWRQLYFANKDAIWKAFESKIGEFQTKRADGTIDETATARKFRFQPLPRTLKLKFYTITPPFNWPSMQPEKGEWDMPVRYVSYDDAERFAEWAGMHIPTEFEWEYAARGPEGRLFPWGNTWERTEKFANWGGKIHDESYETVLIKVATRAGSNPDGQQKDDKGRPLPIDGDGRSWCGCHHMVGNVAEWTSSWFEPYPGNKAKNTFMGRWVKILRGGSAADMEMLALRPACRNWIGGGPDAPPYPDAKFMWAGFRLASYMKSGRDQLQPIVRRAVRSKKVAESSLDLDNFIGSVTRNWVESGAEPVDHIYVKGRANSIVIVPLKSFIRETGMEDMIRAWKRPNSFKKASGIARKASDEHPFWITGVLHTDIKIEPVEVRKIEDPEEDGKKKKKKGRRRGKAKAPETQQGSCAPGTYLFGNWFGRLALFTPGKEFVCFLPKPEDAEKGFKAFEVKKLKGEDRKPPMLSVDPELDWADFEFQIPLGGKGTSEDTRLITRGRLNFELGSLEAAGRWRQEDPAAARTKQLHDQHLAAEAAAAKKKPSKKKKKDDKKADKKKADDKK